MLTASPPGTHPITRENTQEHISRPTRAPYLLVWGPQADGINSQTRAALRLEPWEPVSVLERLPRIITGIHRRGQHRYATVTSTSSRTSRGALIMQLH